MRDGRLSLTTPEGVRLLITPAGPFPRMLAWLIDLFCFAGIAWLGGYTLFSLGKTGSGLYLVLLFLLYWGYPVFCEIVFNGQTFGKRLLNLRVVRANGLPVDWRTSVIRNLLLVADFLPFLYSTGLVMMMSDPHFRRLGDLGASSLVIHVEKPEPRKALPRVEAMAPLFPLTPDQQRALIDLLEREASIPHERMLELATLAEPLTGATDELSLSRLRAIVAGFSQ